MFWAGNPCLGSTSYDGADQPRSVRLEQFRPRVMPGISLVSRHKAAASLVCALNLMISVDTAVAHFAVALGKPILAAEPLGWRLGHSDWPHDSRTTSRQYFTKF